MCGLIALIGNPKSNMLRWFETLLTLDMVRGKDSVGVAAIVDNKPRQVKGAMFPLELIRCKQYQDLIEPTHNKANCYIGHNRLATKGEIKSSNAHPFRHKHITLVHNGTLKEHMKAGQEKEFETDSESIAYAIAEKGIEWTWRNLDGAAAIIYWDAKDKALRFITNGDRPLVFNYSMTKEHLFIGSETWMLEEVAAHNEIKLEEKVFWKPHDHELFTIRYDNKLNIVTEETQKLKHRTFTYATSQYYKDLSATVQRPNSLVNMGWEEKNRPLLDLKAEEQARQERLKTRKGSIQTMVNIGNRPTVPIINNKQKISEVAYNDLIKDHADAAQLLMGRADFYAKYKNCAFCLEALTNEYETAMIVDDHIAVCGSCAQQAIFLNIPITAAALRGA